MADRNATTTWNGDLGSGSGLVTLDSSNAGQFPVSFATRAEDPAGQTSPEELIAAAHSSCFSMQLSGVLGESGLTPERIDASAEVTLGKSGGGFAITGIALTKIDVLDGFERLRIGVGYRLDGATIDYFPASQGAQARVEPIYEEMEGWSGSTAGARSWADLPAQAIKYVRRIEELIRCPVALVSTSPEREDTILVRDPFAG